MFLHLCGCLAHLPKGELRVDEYFGHHGLRRNTQAGKILLNKTERSSVIQSIRQKLKQKSSMAKQYIILFTDGMAFIYPTVTEYCHLKSVSIPSMLQHTTWHTVYYDLNAVISFSSVWSFRTCRKWMLSSVSRICRSSASRRCSSSISCSRRST